MKKLLLLFVIFIWFAGCNDEPVPIVTCGGATCEDWQECKEDKCELKEDFCETNENCTTENPICGDDHKCKAKEICDTTCEEWESCVETECKLTEGRCNTNSDCSDSKVCDNNHNCIVDNPCNGFSCTENSTCSVVNEVATCICDNGFEMKDDKCVAVDLCNDFSCTENSTCSVVNEVATCICDNGFEMKDDKCVAVTNCDNLVCGDFSSCQIIDNIPTCICDENYHLEGVACISNSKEVPCDSSTSPIHADTTIIDVEITWNRETNSWTSPANCEWVCKEGYIKQENSCIPIATCDPACSEWQTCNNGTCELTEGRCENSEDCNGGICGVDHNCIDLCADTICSDWKECNSSNGICKLKAGKCERTTDCSENEICDLNHDCISTIVCNPTCNDWETCTVNNQCRLNDGRCNSNDDCEDSKFCSDEHSCEDIVGCDPLCNDWETCNNGDCEPKEGRCNTNSDCDSNICAVGNRCFYPEAANKLLLNLTWDTPGDLDIRLRNQATYLDREWDTDNSCYYANCKEGNNYHISWYDNGDNNPVLTRDDIQAMGPETIEITDFLPTIGYYTVGIHNYNLDPFAIATLKIYCKGYLVSNITTNEIANRRFLEAADIRVNDQGVCEVNNLLSTSVVKPDLCKNQFCSNHGECILGVQNAYCECEDGYHAEGMNCVNGQDPCEQVDCGDNGTCSVNQDGEAVCICENGYHPEGLICVINGENGCTVLTSEECRPENSCEPGDMNNCEPLGNVDVGGDCDAQNRCSSAGVLCIEGVCKNLCDPNAQVSTCLMGECINVNNEYGYCIVF